MSSSEMSLSAQARRGRLVVLLGATLALGGCFQPMYAQQTPVVASTAPGAAPVGVDSALSAIDILPVDGRVGQKIRNELIFALSGGAGVPAKPLYRLDLTVQVIGAQTAIVDPYTDRPELETSGVDVSYALVRVGTGAPVMSGNALGRATYTRNRQRFASTRAQRDAEDRAAKVAVGQIRAKLMSHFATKGL